VAKDVRGVSPDTIAVGVFSIAGTLLGVVAGLFGERYVRRIGDLRCKVAGVELVAENGGDPVSLSLDAIVPEIVDAASFITCKFNVKLFNEKDVPTGLRDLMVIFHSKMGPDVEAQPYDRATWRSEGRVPGFVGIPTIDPVQVINLPAGVWVNIDMECSLDGEDKDQLPWCDRIELRGFLPAGAAFEQEIARLKTAPPG
jgi:hypothetical protein